MSVTDGALDAVTSLRDKVNFSFSDVICVIVPWAFLVPFTSTVTTVAPVQG